MTSSTTVPHLPPSPRSTLASRVATSDATSHLDEKSLNAVFNSLRDRVYQRSFNLRKTFRELDAQGNGAVPIEAFAAEMARSFSLSGIELKCLRVLLEEADFRRDGKIDFREFCEMLKMRDYDSDAVVSDAQRKRLQGPGVMDPRMQRMVKDGSQAIHVQGGVPTNELGHMRIECPFGVLGDSERMDAVITAFFTHKLGQLRAAFERFDDDKDGCLTRQQFRDAMKEVDRYVFDNEIDSLLEAILDGHNTLATGRRTLASSQSSARPKHNNLININQFVNGPGKEYLKKKAHRSNAHANPFIWNQPPEPPRSSQSPRRPPNSPRAAKRAPLKPAADTRSNELRALEMRTRLLELRRDDPYFAMALDDRRGRNGNTGGGTPRLPQIPSARNSAVAGGSARQASE